MKNFTKPKLEIADIFNQYSDQLTGISTDCHKEIRAIKSCRTEALGKHVRNCNECEHQEISYNSCRNRHCPKCGFLAKAKWVDKRVEELLPCSYFHVVFTLPAVLNPLMLRNKEELYNLLFKASKDTLTEVAKRKKNLGAELGFIGVLHTWGQNLMDHPHIHYIVPGAGLNKSKDEWVKCKSKYLLPVKILAKVFRGKFLSELEKLYERDKLKLNGQIALLQDKQKFKNLLVESSKKDWVVYSKKPFAGAKQVINYLGQYTHRIAISNHRLIKIQAGKVYFKYRDSKGSNKSKVMALEVKEFMRRFLLHVLPKGFVRIRHFGLLANRSKNKNIETIRKILDLPHVVKSKDPKEWPELLQKFVEIDLSLCPNCKSGTMQIPTLINTS